MGGSGWTRNGKPASPLRKGGRRSSSSCTQLDGAGAETGGGGEGRGRVGKK